MCWNILTERLTMSILRGPLAGKRWLIASRRSFLLGTYEVEQIEAFATSVREGDVVFDIGAHWGYYTLLASMRVGPAGQVFAFEPSQCNLRRLRRHCEINGCENVRLLDVAVSDRNGTARLNEEHGSRAAHLSEDGTADVKVVTLDSLVNNGLLPPPNVMKVDIEGAEVAMLKGSESVLTSARPLIFLSTHAFAGSKEPCCQFLTERGYDLEPLNGSSLADASDFLATPPAD